MVSNRATHHKYLSLNLGLFRTYCNIDAYSEPTQMDLFAKIINDFQSLTIFAKGSILDVCLGFERTFATLLET